ncbi:MAG: hypothetical protein BHW09_08065 [Clostridium sp. CAG:245_30_32]|nr:MAG: hypothetical protein BHW09_08065 [Clostridium sp. CAG:245_30_32]
MKENDLIELLHKVLNVPKLAFGANTVEPYKELQYITEKADYILYLQNMYLINKNNLKIYKDDEDTIQNIKENISRISEEIKKKCQELEEFYDKRVKEGWNITTKFNNDYSIDNKDKEAIEHILSDYKRVLKENKKIRNGRNRLFEYATAQQTTPEMLNKILREDYIPKDKIEEILDETEITDFNSLVEAFLEIKKLLESEE